MGVRDVILVVQKGDHSLGYYDFGTGAEMDRMPVDLFPHEFSLSPDGRFAYLAHFGVALAEHPGPGGNTVSVVDVQARRRVGTIDCKTYRRPHDVAFDGNGRLYVLSDPFRPGATPIPWLLFRCRSDRGQRGWLAL